MSDTREFCSVHRCLNNGVNLILGKWFCYDHRDGSRDAESPVTHGIAQALMQGVSMPTPPRVDAPKANDDFTSFMDGARHLVEGRAVEKGYNDGGSDRNDLMEFTNKFFPGHAGGEICYKAIRYSRKKDKTDLLKVAAWAYLLWRYDES